MPHRAHMDGLSTFSPRRGRISRVDDFSRPTHATYLVYAHSARLNGAVLSAQCVYPMEPVCVKYARPARTDRLTVEPAR